MTFNQKEYTIKYIKENRARFLVDLTKEEKKELDEILKEDNLTKAEFLRQAIKQYKKARAKKS
jgi:metal-responsive CopG/Arc/MetJ family transcriptional regulator